MDEVKLMQAEWKDHEINAERGDGCCKIRAGHGEERTPGSGGSRRPTVHAERRHSQHCGQRPR